MKIFTCLKRIELKSWTLSWVDILSLIHQNNRDLIVDIKQPFSTNGWTVEINNYSMTNNVNEDTFNIGTVSRKIMAFRPQTFNDFAFYSFDSAKLDFGNSSNLLLLYGFKMLTDCGFWSFKNI